jgi:hypothetical protein
VVVSPFSAPVLGGAALVTAPAWWNVVQGTSPATDAMTRFLICVAVCWVAFELLAAFVGPAPQPAPADGAAEELAEQAPPG